MGIKIQRNVVYGPTTRNVIAQLLGIVICTAVLLLFVALTYSQITLPQYTAKYNQKDTQQVVNLLITVAATLIGILLSHCRRVTNEAETKKELHDEKLTIPRLHVHFEAGGSKLAMGAAAFGNRDVWRLVALYIFAMIIFGFLHSVLSVIFVIDGIISDQGVQEPVLIPLSSEIPWKYKGRNIDACSNKISNPDCYYELANTALSSQLITYIPYTIGGVTFEPGNGTMGLPYYAMKHFTQEVTASQFDEERRQYCLPVLDPHIIKCKEEPFNQQLGETNSSAVRYTPLDVFVKDDSGTYNSGDSDEIPTVGIVAISVPKGISVHDVNNIKYRTGDQDMGTMLVRMNPHKEFWNTTIITASNEGGSRGYASLLHKLMYGVKPDPSVYSQVPSGSTYCFAAKCEMTSIMHRDNYLSSWRKVNFTFKNGVSRANVTEEHCPNPRGNYTSGFRDLYFDLEGASAVLSSTDGYPKLFNENQDTSSGTPIYDKLSRLDSIVNQMYAITQTGWSASNHDYAIELVPAITDNPVMMTRYPHLYVIRISWTPTTYIGLVLSLLITLNAYILAGRWLRAIYHFGFDSESWNLLHPVDLMAYSLAAYRDLVYDLNTVEHRRSAMRGKRYLRELPIKEGTQNLIDLINDSTPQSSLPSPSSTTPNKTLSGTVRDRAGEEEKQAGVRVMENNGLD